MPKSKICASFDEAMADIADGATIMIGGFGVLGGLPQNLVLALCRKGVKGLTLIANSGGLGPEISKLARPPNGYQDHGLLFQNKQVKKFIGSVPALGARPSTAPIEVQFNKGEIEIETFPQGTLAEKIRAGGAGIGGFYTPVGLGTIVEKGKEVRVINGKRYLLELPLRADFALIKAWRADTFGNLIYRGTSRSFNPIMATAAEVTIAEVEKIVAVGELDPNQVHTPGIYISRLVEIKKERHQ